MAEVKSEKLGKMPEGKLLFEMSLPIIISMLVQAIYNIVDSIFVARLSEKALTAVTISFPIQNIIIAFSVGLSIGVSALLSRYLGMKNEKKASSVAVHGIILSALMSLIFIFIAIFFVEPFIKMQTNDPKIISYGIDYLHIVCLFSLGVFFQIFFEKLLQSTGLTVYTMVTQVIGAVINIILDPIFIFGLFGFPRLEVKGAAIATVTGQILGALIGLLLNLVKNKEVKLTFKGFSMSHLIFKEIFSIGLPAALMNAITSFATFFINTILAGFGQSAIAVYGVMFKLQSFEFMPVLGISNAIVPIISYNFGAGNKERIKKSIELSITWATLMIIFGMIIFMVFPEAILNLFSATDRMKEIGIPMIRIVAISYLPVGFSIVCASIFQSLSSAGIALFEPFLRQFIILLPLMYLIGEKTGDINKIWYSFIIAEFLAGLYCAYFLRRDYKEKIEKINIK